MSFLAPMFLIGGLAVGLPILFHLIRRTSKDKIPFSSLMFLVPTPPRVTRRSRLENIWLLILRCLVILLLAAGFARPFIQKPLSANPNSGNGARIVVLLDTSASMRRSGLWQDARAEAESIVKRAAPGDQIAMMAFDREVRPLWTFDDWSRMSPPERMSRAKQQLQSLNPGWNGTYLGNALIQASEMLQDSRDKQVENRRIIVISDLQKGSHLDGLQGHEWPSGVEVTLQQVKNRKDNAGLQLISEREESADGELKIRVNNASDASHEQFRVGWRKNNALAGETVSAYVPPGQSRIFTAPKAATNLALEQLVLMGDQEDFDNIAYWVLPKPERIPLLYVGKDDVKNPEQLLYYIHRAFQQTRSLDVQIVSWPQTNNQPTETQSAKLALVAEDASENQIEFARTFLANGNTVLFPLRTKDAAKALGRLSGQSGVEVTEAAGSGYSMLSEIDFEHPLFAPFADPRFNDFTKIHFWKHRRLDLKTMDKPRVVARFENGDPALVQLAIGKGTLLVITSGWNPADSQLALSSKFVPLLYGILEQSGSIRLQKTSYIVGDDVPIPVAPAGSQVVVAKPDGTEEPMPAGQKFRHADIPGIYTIRGVEPVFKFAVNLEADESKTAPMNVEDLQKLGVPVREKNPGMQKMMEKQQQHLQAVELENRQKLWRWLIVTAIMVLIVETWLAGRLTRRAAQGAAT
jgi:hypothetical protein